MGSKVHTSPTRVGTHQRTAVASLLAILILYSMWKTFDVKDCLPVNFPSYVTGGSYNPRLGLPDRLAEAVFMATSLKRSDSYTQLVCPKSQELSDRPANHDVKRIGTPCEAWQNRELIEVLWEVLDSSMVGLEWSSGSGTAWMLRRGVTLHSIEHCKPWLDDITQKMEDIGGVGKWFPYHIARSDGKGCEQNIPNNWDIMDQVFGDYVRYPRKNLMNRYAPHGFDIVSVDGRFRDGCIVEAASLDDPNQPMLVRNDYGILLLDNAERTHFVKPAELPSHWLVVSFANAVDETAIWMTCPTKDDEYCTRARVRIAKYMATLPKDVVGNRYHVHMARAKADGVPGA